jgi:hypothetical protein
LVLLRKGDVCLAISGQLSDFDEPFDMLMVLSFIEGLSRVAISLKKRKKNDFKPQSDR